MLRGPLILLGATVLAMAAGLSIIPSLLGFGNVADTACEVCDHRSAAFGTFGFALPVAALGIAGLLLGTLLFWKPERKMKDQCAAAPARACSNCGKGLEADWTLCPFCGQSTSPDQDYP